jgi:hypothetical protein
MMSSLPWTSPYRGPRCALRAFRRGSRSSAERSSHFGGLTRTRDRSSPLVLAQTVATPAYRGLGRRRLGSAPAASPEVQRASLQPADRRCCPTHERCVIRLVAIETHQELRKQARIGRPRGVDDLPPTVGLIAFMEMLRHIDPPPRRIGPSAMGRPNTRRCGPKSARLVISRKTK